MREFLNPFSRVCLFWIAFRNSQMVVLLEMQMRSIVSKQVGSHQQVVFFFLTICSFIFDYNKHCPPVNCYLLREKMTRKKLATWGLLLCFFFLAHLGQNCSGVLTNLTVYKQILLQGKAQGCISGICSLANVVSPLAFSPLTGSWKLIQLEALLGILMPI